MATKKPALGRGIDALITVDPLVKKKKEETKEDVSRETLMDINKIEPNKLQPRKHFDQDALEELAESIKQHGIIQPIVVQKKGKMYEIIAGERRWRAARIAGLKKVPVIVKEYTDDEVFEIALIENLQRADLNPIEEAQAYKRLMSEYGLKQDDVAERVSKSRTAITNSMRLLKLHDKVQELVIGDMISAGHARALLSIEDEQKQFDIAMKIIDEKLSVRETEKLAKKLLSAKETSKPSRKNLDDEAVYRDYESRMKDSLGLKVSVLRKTNETGKIVIEYSDVDEFEKIYEALTSAR